MIKPVLSFIIIAVLFTSCKREQDPFQIGKQHIGLLTDSTQVKDLKTIFSNDSIVKFIGGDEFIGNRNNIDIFEKGGKKYYEGIYGKGETNATLRIKSQYGSVNFKEL